MSVKRFIFWMVIISSLFLPLYAQAAANLTLTPLTWNTLGLDSNNVLVGPQDFPVGARVCNTGDAAAANVTSTFVWDTTDTYINLRPGSLSSYAGANAIATLAAGSCTDFYYEVQITRNALAYDHKARYHITATANGLGTFSTPVPRELFVERLISQSRNGIVAVELNGVTVPAGGSMSLMVGNTYTIKLDGFTATQGYNQLESFINFPNTVFQLLSVSTTFSADSNTAVVPNPNAALYADACVWENDPNSPNYRSCVGVDNKAGGTVGITYTVKIIGGGGARETLNSLFYDFSGSSFHYNSDYSTGAVFANIVDPTNVAIAKSFSPNPTNVNGLSTMTITLTNPNPGAIGGLNFVDVFPTSPGAMTVASPLTTSSTCGGTLQDSGGGSLAAADVGIKLINGAVAANSSCIVTVNVTAAATGTYANTTDNLYVDALDTGKSASAVLSVTTTPPPPAPPAFCTTPVELARWAIPTTGQGSSSGTTPPPYTSKASDVATATTSFFSTASPPLAAGVSSIQTTGSAAANSWGGTAPVTVSNPPLKTAGWVETTTSFNNYFQFALDTRNYGGVYVKFNAGLFPNGDWAAPISNVFVNTQADSGAFSVYTTSPTPTYPPVTKGGWTTGIIATAASTGANTTTFRMNFDGGSKDTALAQLDDIIFYGCRKPDPPTITKAFSPNPVAVGGTSTLTFTITNPNAAGQTLHYGINFTDYLPQSSLQGTVTASSTAVVGTGTAFKTQLTAGSIVSLPSTLTGTVAVTNGSAAVVGTSTTFTGLASGSIMSINATDYTVASVADDTHLTLSSNYAGSTTSGLALVAYSTYTVSSIADDTHLTLGASHTGTDQTMLAGLTFTAAAPTTTCGSAVTNVASGGRALTLSGATLTGTLALTNASASVTGTSTKFTTELGTGVTGAGRILLVPFQLAGTVAVTSGSPSVVGTGTTFTTQLAVRQSITINAVDYIVNAIADDTHLTLTTNYAGSTASGLNARGNKEYALSSVTSDTVLVLSTAYASGANLSGLTVKAGLAGGSSTCTVTATVQANAAGVRSNVSGVITAAESGANTTVTGYATANLTAVLPPVISKLFAPNPIVTGGTSTLTFTITNPNLNNALSGVTFTDTFPIAPSAMTVASPLTTTNTCTTGGTPGILYRSDGTTALASGHASIRLGSSTDTNTATIAAGGSCTITVKVTATPATPPGTYANTSGSVAHIIGGSAVNGNTASDTLKVNAPNPQIAIKKQVGGSSTGSWFDKLAIAAGSNVYYRFTVENIGDVAFTAFHVTDPTLAGAFGNPISCTWVPVGPSLPVGTPAVDPSATCVVGPVPAASGEHQNTATAHGTYPAGSKNSTPDTATYQTTALSIVKTAAESSFDGYGALLHYSYAVTNSGYASLLGPVTVADDKVTVTCPGVLTTGDLDTYFDPGESVTCTAAEYEVTEADYTAGFVTNTASASVGGVTSPTVSLTVSLIPTRVFITAFGASEENGQVSVRWETAAEHNTLGFNLFRLNPVTGDYEKLNSGLLPSVLRPHRGGKYTFKDTGAAPGKTSTYRLVEVEIHGNELSYGPFTVFAGGSTDTRGAGFSPGSDYTREERHQPELHMARMKDRQPKRQQDVRAPGSGDRIKITVTDSGMYFVDAREISSLLGITLSKVSAMIARGMLSLSNQGRQVAYLPAAANAGLFFYGMRIESIYTKDNVYWLDKARGTLMTVREGAGPGSSSVAGSFSETVHLEEDTVSWETLFSDPGADYWFWDQLFASASYTDPPKSFTFEPAGLAIPQTTATLQVHLLGGSDAKIANDHHVLISLNGQTVEGWWSGLTPHTITAPVSLNAGENTITVMGQADSGVSSSFVLIDSFDVTYQRAFEADGNALFFRGDGAPTVTVGGFSSPEIMVFDLTNPLRPIWDKATSIGTESGISTSSVRPLSADTPYLAVAGSGVKAASAKAVTASHLSSSRNAADYLVIAPAELVSTARGLAAYRKSQGFTTKVVDLEEVMNQFGYGISSPEAIKKFLWTAHKRWKTAPRFVVLAGDGSGDYKDNLKFGGNLIPSRMVPTNYGLAMSDNYLAARSGSSMPETAIGRLPVVSPEELETVINKIKTHESNLGHPTAVLVADFPDEGGDFIADSEALVGLFPAAYTVKEIYLTDPTLSETTKTALIEAINGGAAFVNYVGHAGPDQLSNWGLFSSYPYPEYDPPADDLPLLTNANVLPVMTAMTCGLANFADPYQDVLGEALLLKPDGGVAAIWSASGLSDDTQARILNREFYRAVFSGNKRILGNAVRQALSQYKKKGSMRFMMDSYIILGDPALRMR